jgi:hypothetical protein
MVELVEREVASRPVGDRFSGHESFACRYGWLPKFHEILVRSPDLIRDDEAVMVELGIGRNMVKSLRFWAQAFGLMVDTPRQTPTPTPFAHWLLDAHTGHDPFLEDVGSLWLLHWRLVSTAQLAMWEVAFFETPEREVLRRYLAQKVERRALALERKVSSVTVRHHVDIFLATYASPAALSGASIEEALACPLQELGLVRLLPAGDRDEVVAFARGPWPHLDTSTFARILLDYWRLRAPHDSTLTLRALSTDFAGPGLVLRLDEGALWSQLTRVCEQLPKLFELTDGVERRAVSLKAVSLAEAVAKVGYA